MGTYVKILILLCKKGKFRITKLRVNFRFLQEFKIKIHKNVKCVRKNDSFFGRFT